MTDTIKRIIFGAAAVLAGGAISFAETFPGTDEGSKQLANALLKPGADCPALSKQPRPTPADYAAVFERFIYVNGNWRVFPKPWRALKE